MQKQEHLQVHALFMEIGRDVADREEATEILAEYEAMDTRPWSISASKGKHHDATMTLVDGIATWVQQEATTELEPTIR